MAIIYSDKTPLNFTFPHQFDINGAEKQLIDSCSHEIIKNYGLTFLYFSQTKNFPVIPSFSSLNEGNLTYELLFHAYGDVLAKNRFNAPFPARGYFSFENDTLNLSSFGIFLDSTVELFLNKNDFILQAASALSGYDSFLKEYNLPSFDCPPNNIISFEVKGDIEGRKFKLKIKTQIDLKSQEVNCQICEFDIDFDKDFSIIKNSYAPFIRKSLTTLNLLSPKSEAVLTYTIFNNRCIKPKLRLDLLLKNPWKTISNYNLNQISPSVGDLVFLQGVGQENHQSEIKLEITEVRSENKTKNGLNPLFTSYQYLCVLKPYIADDLSEATELTKGKMKTILSLNEGAQTTIETFEKYQDLYKESGYQFKQDDIYGGYDSLIGQDGGGKIETLPPDLENQSIKAEVTSNHFSFSLFGYTFTYTEKELYDSFRLLMNREYMKIWSESGINLQEKNHPFVLYSPELQAVGDGGLFIDTELETGEHTHHNIRRITFSGKVFFSYKNINEKYWGLEEEDFRIYDIIFGTTEPYLGLEDGNPELLSVLKEKYYSKGIKAPIPYFSKSLYGIYKERLKTYYGSYFSTFIRHSGKLTKPESTDLNEFKYVIDDSVAYGDVTIIFNRTYFDHKSGFNYRWSDLLTIYRFTENIRLCTNGVRLFVEKTKKSNKKISNNQNNIELYRAEITSLNDPDIHFKKVKTFNSLIVTGTQTSETLDITKGHKFIKADDGGIYFFPIFYYPDTPKALNLIKGGYERPSNNVSDINSKDSKIITFKDNLMTIELTRNKNDCYNINKRVIYVPSTTQPLKMAELARPKMNPWEQ